MERRRSARCGWLWAAALAVVASGPPEVLASSAATRTPQRELERASSLEWLPDVRARLRALESHAADAARERMRSTTLQAPSGWSAPRPPAAGDGSAR